MDVQNLNRHAIPAKLVAPDGSADYVTVQAGRRVTLPDGYTVDSNWLALTPKVRAYTDASSKTPISLKGAQPQIDLAQVAKITVGAAPAPAQTNPDVKAD